LNYHELDESTKAISKNLEKLGIFGGYKSFKDLRARAFRSDLWRWMVLWDEGGIYIDSKFVFNNKTDWIDFEYDEFLICPA
jgi:mannosyltransferase OCH1-like enzyme